MTIAVPQVSIDTQQANTSAGSINNSQEITSLSDGTFVVVFQESGTVHFQQFDQFGNKIGGEGTLVTPNFASGTAISVLAVEDNKLVLAYETSTNVIQAQSYSIVDGVGATTADISHELFAGGLVTADIAPSISGTSLADVSVHALLSAGGGIRELVTFTDLDTANPQSTQISTNFTSTSLQEATVLTNGNTVVLIDTNGQGAASTTAVDFIVLAPDGTEVTRGTSAPNDSGVVGQPQITALTGGGFVVAYLSDDGFDRDVIFQVFDADGVAIGGSSAAFSNNPDANDDPEIVALEDGGFIVFFDRDNVDSRIFGRRFDEDGVATGGLFRVDEGTNTAFPVATLLDDGMVAVANSNGGNIVVTIVATEALDVVLTDADETIIGTIEDDTIEGAGGADDIDGSDGFDFVSFAGSQEGVTLSLEDGSGTAGDANGDTYANVEGVIGSDFDDDITGNSEDNTILAGAGNDTVALSGGNNTLDGGTGKDTLVVIPNTTSSVVNLADGTASFPGFGFTSTISNFENVIGSTKDDTITGNNGANDITGEGGQDTINAGAGKDTVDGGDGIDIIDGGAGKDTLEGGFGSDTIRGGTGNDSIFGAFADDIDGTTNGDQLFGDEGRDTIFGSGGDDTIDGGTGNDILDGRDGFDSISGGAGKDKITGGGGNDNINGGDGNDTLEGGAGLDVVNGGDGDDLIFANTELDQDGPPVADNVALDGVINGDQLFGGTGNDTIFGSIRNDVLVGDVNSEFDVHLDNDDFLDGGDGNDVIAGGNGEDTLIGGEGDDKLDGQQGDDTVTGGLGNDAITGGLGKDTLDGGAGDDSIDGDEGNDIIKGQAGDDDLSGNNGRDDIDGGVGVDTIQGGAGRDILFGGNDTDFDTIFGGSGADEITTGNGGSQVFGDGGADTIQGGDDADTAFGGSGDDLISGNGGDDELHGEEGNDTIDGGAGSDTLRGGDGRDEIYGGSGIDFITGGAGDDTMTGGAGDDFLQGNDGDDLFIGGTGDDSYFGGTGFDTIDYSASGSGVDVTLDIDARTAGVGSSGDANGDILMSIEALIGTAFNDQLTGNVKDNSFTGGAGNDVLDGAEGDDTLLGGDGDDLLIGGDDDDVIDGGDGIDTVRFSGDRADFELVLAQGGVITATHLAGDIDTITDIEVFAFDDVTLSFADLFVSNTPTEGDDVIDGAAGDDTIDALGGDDIVNGLGGNDDLSGGDGKDTLDGGAGEDTLSGGIGKDILIGGLDRDFLTGNGGRDTFQFNTQNDSLTGSQSDQITDFIVGIDEIDLSNITVTPFTIEIDGAFSGTGPSVITREQASGNTVVLADIDGDQSADMRIILQNTLGLTVDDFVL